MFPALKGTTLEQCLHRTFNQAESLPQVLTHQKSDFLESPQVEFDLARQERPIKSAHECNDLFIYMCRTYRRISRLKTGTDYLRGRWTHTDSQCNESKGHPFRGIWYIDDQADFVLRSGSCSGGNDEASCNSDFIEKNPRCVSIVSVTHCEFMSRLVEKVLL